MKKFKNICYSLALANFLIIPWTVQSNNISLNDKNNEGITVSPLFNTNNSKSDMLNINSKNYFCTYDIDKTSDIGIKSINLNLDVDQVPLKVCLNPNFNKWTEIKDYLVNKKDNEDSLNNIYKNGCISSGMGIKMYLIQEDLKSKGTFHINGQINGLEYDQNYYPFEKEIKNYILNINQDVDFGSLNMDLSHPEQNLHFKFNWQFVYPTLPVGLSKVNPQDIDFSFVMENATMMNTYLKYVIATNNVPSHLELSFVPDKDKQIYLDQFKTAIGTKNAKWGDFNWKYQEFNDDIKSNVINKPVSSLDTIPFLNCYIENYDKILLAPSDTQTPIDIKNIIVNGIANGKLTSDDVGKMLGGNSQNDHIVLKIINLYRPNLDTNYDGDINDLEHLEQPKIEIIKKKIDGVTKVTGVSFLVKPWEYTKEWKDGDVNYFYEDYEHTYTIGWYYQVGKTHEVLISESTLTFSGRA